MRWTEIRDTGRKVERSGMSKAGVRGGQQIKQKTVCITIVVRHAHRQTLNSFILQKYDFSIHLHLFLSPAPHNDPPLTPLSSPLLITPRAADKSRPNCTAVRAVSLCLGGQYYRVAPIKYCMIYDKRMKHNAQNFKWVPEESVNEKEKSGCNFYVFPLCLSC